MYSEGKTPEQIASALDTTLATVKRDIDIILEKQSKLYAESTPQHNFVRYAAFQLNVVRKLGQVADTCLGYTREAPDPAVASKSGATAVQALKAQSDIYDKVMDKGEKLGVIQGESQDSPVLIGTPRGMRVQLREKLLTLEALLDEIDDSEDTRSKRKALPAASRSLVSDAQSDEQATQKRHSGTTRKHAVKIKRALRDKAGYITFIPSVAMQRRAPVHNKARREAAEQAGEALHQQLQEERIRTAELRRQLADERKQKARDRLNQDSTVQRHRPQQSKPKQQKREPLPQPGLSGWLIPPKHLPDDMK